MYLKVGAEISGKRHKKRRKHKAPASSGGQVDNYEIGLKHFQNGNYRDAIKAWRDVSPGKEIAPKLAEVHFGYGLSFYNGGQVV